jgi:hypothetical protein
MQNHFKGFTMEYIERSRNNEADQLAKAATHKTPLHADVFFHVIQDASVKTIEPGPG